MKSFLKFYYLLCKYLYLYVQDIIIFFYVPDSIYVRDSLYVRDCVGGERGRNAHTYFCFKTALIECVVGGGGRAEVC